MELIRRNKPKALLKPSWLVVEMGLVHLQSRIMKK
jgi:hypothetical protein